ncbi:MAG: hypothetical protein ACRDGV_00805 [Candidatus Limnocylindria bacterium]
MNPPASLHPVLLAAASAVASSIGRRAPVEYDHSETGSGEAVVITVAAARSDNGIGRRLAEMGFAQVGGMPQVRRYVGYDPATDRWLTLELRPQPTMHASRPSRARRRIGSVVDWILARRPGITVAVVGPDGAGKSTLISGLARSFALPVRTFYAGLYPQGETRRNALVGLGTLQQLVRLWRIRALASYHRRRGRLVIFDRYPYDALLPLPPRARRRSSWRRALLARACAAPDLLIALDAPSEVLRQRRDEHPVERIEAHRLHYAELARTLPNGELVDASQGIEAVRRRATDLVWRRYASSLRGAGR